MRGISFASFDSTTELLPKDGEKYSALEVRVKQKRKN
jgi:hypothetical protein